MTNFEKIKQLDLNELAKLLLKINHEDFVDDDFCLRLCTHRGECDGNSCFALKDELRGYDLWLKGEAYGEKQCEICEDV